MKVKIYGYGWVGKAMHTLFPDAEIYDPQQSHYSEVPCDVAFICVPTPLGADGKLDCSIVEGLLTWIKEDLIIIRSTVNPGFCAMMRDKYGKNIVFSPEYLGETPNHPLLDQKARPFLILGGNPEDRRKAIELYQSVYNANVTIRQVTLKEAEIIKLAENRAIAFKVMQCQELYDVCEAANIDYYTIRDAVYGDDPRMNLWFTFIYPNKRGFHDSKCLPKDVPAFCAWAESVGVDAELTKLLVAKSHAYALGNNPVALA